MTDWQQYRLALTEEARNDPLIGIIVLGLEFSICVLRSIVGDFFKPPHLDRW